MHTVVTETMRKLTAAALIGITLLAGACGGEETHKDLPDGFRDPKPKEVKWCHNNGGTISDTYFALQRSGGQNYATRWVPICEIREGR